MVIGRGRGKSTPNQRASRVRKKSLKQRESEEYMSAYESLTDIVITNGRTTDVMQNYEDSILEDNAFVSPDEVVMVAEDEEVIPDHIVEETMEHLVDSAGKIKVIENEEVVEALRL